MSIRLRDARILISGLGLMGGSLGLALAGSAGEIVGVDPDGEARRLAVELGAVNATAAGGEISSAAAGAHLVVLAVPLGAMADALAALSPHLAPGTVVTDLGSVKVPLVRELLPLVPPDVAYVPGHPMAGSEVAGMPGARADLFEGANWILTGETHPLVERVIEVAGAQMIRMDAARHDRIVAHTSHLPLMMAAAAAEAALAAHEEDPEAFSLLAAGGFRDTTRVAAGSVPMGVDMCMYNARELDAPLRAAIRALEELHETISRGERGELMARMSKIREALLKARG